jgi:hypothetical protein
MHEKTQSFRQRRAWNKCYDAYQLFSYAQLRCNEAFDKFINAPLLHDLDMGPTTLQPRLHLQVERERNESPLPHAARPFQRTYEPVEHLIVSKDLFSSVTARSVRVAVGTNDGSSRKPAACAFRARPPALDKHQTLITRTLSQVRQSCLSKILDSVSNRKAKYMNINVFWSHFRPGPCNARELACAVSHVYSPVFEHTFLFVSVCHQVPKARCTSARKLAVQRGRARCST